MRRHVPAAGVYHGRVLAYRALLFGLASYWGGSFSMSVAVSVSLCEGSVGEICMRDG